MPRFANRVAIVTGAARGLGAASARRLSEEGARVLVCDINGDGALRSVDAIRSSGGTAEALECDVGMESGVRDMVVQAVRHWGRLDLVVNNAYAGLDAARV